MGGRQKNLNDLLSPCQDICIAVPPFNTCAFFRKPVVRSSNIQIYPDTRSRDEDVKDDTGFGAVDEQQERIEKFERLMGEQKKKLDLQQKVIEEQNKKLLIFKRIQEENDDLELIS